MNRPFWHQLINNPFWHQLWNKGVDIAAGVITSLFASAIAAVIVTFVWRKWNRYLDLKRLEQQRAALAQGARKAHNYIEQADLLDRYFGWMKEKDLDLLPENVKIITKFKPWAEVTRTAGAIDGNLYQDPKIAEKSAKDIAAAIESTQIRP
jgi:hypothetical protein